MRPSARRLALALVAAGLAPASWAAPLVVVSVAPQRGIVERLAADAVEVVTLVPPGTDVETYSPTAQQMAALERAELVFWVGHPAFPLEARLLAPWLERHPAVARVALVDHDPDAALDGDAVRPAVSHGNLRGDPHLWLSPRIVRAATAELARQLATVLPDQAAAIGERAAAFDAEIAALDERLRARLGGGGRFLIDHPSLGYLARDYGLEQVALERDGKEPTPAQLARLIEQARRDRFRVVLVQRGAARRGAELLARALDAELLEIDPLAADWLASSERLGAALERARIDD